MKRLPNESGLTLRAAFLFLISVFLAGCASEHFKKGRGDVGQFVLQQAVKRGGMPTTNSLPAIPGAWCYSEDQHGVVVRMSPDKFPAVEAFLRRAFGTPKLEPIENSDGRKLGVYRLSAKGGGIQFGCDAKRTQIIVLRPLSDQELFRAIKDAANETDKSR